MPFPPTFDRVFDETFPPDTQAANLLGQDIRNLKTDIRERFALISGTFANRPTNMDATFGGAGYGMLYFATDTHQVFQWNGGGWVDVTALLFGSSTRIVASVNLLAQPAAIGLTSLYLVPGGAAGLYRVSGDLFITTVGTGGTISFGINWNNGVASIGISSGTVNTVGLGNETSSPVPSIAAPFYGVLYSPAGANIFYSTTFNAVTGAPQYALRMRLEYLG